MRAGLTGVSIIELFIELTRLLVDGSHVELLDAALVEDWRIFLPAGPVAKPLFPLLAIEIR